MKTQSLRARNITLLLASTMTVMAGATIAPALPAMEKAFASIAQAMVLAVETLATDPDVVEQRLLRRKRREMIPSGSRTGWCLQCFPSWRRLH